MSDEKICPACGKPTAGYVPCPHCGADPSQRLSIKAAVVLCVLLLGIGLAYFLYHTATITPQPISIASIDGWMNYASVWIEGTVISGPQVDDRSISFEVQDASGGSIEAEVYMDPQSLKAQGNIPMVGDSVKLFGMLRVYLDGSIEIRVSSLGKDQFTGEDKFQVTSAQPVSTTIPELKSTWYTSQSLKYKRVTLQGTITGMRPLYSARVYTLEDNENNTIDIYVHNGLIYAENRELDVKLLQTISVTVGASEYGQAPQLALASYDYIQVIENRAPALVGIENVSENHRGEFISTGGRIVFVEMTGESNSLEVEKRYLWLDNKDNPQVWMWESVYKLLPDNTRKLLKRGPTAQLTGRVSSSGELKIELVGPPELSLVENTYEPPFVENVAEIVSDNKDEFVTIQGEVITSENVGTGLLVPCDRKFTLQDNLGGTIKIWISNTVYERMSELPSTGDNLRVVGKVAESGGEIQVRLGLPSDVEKV